MSDRAIDILQRNGLRNTPSRLRVLETFLQRDAALSHADIEENIEGNFDRVTIYRTLNTFQENGILHKVPDASGMARFAMCSDQCGHDHHDDNHVHFQCRNCGTSQCLIEVQAPAISLPEGFRAENMQFLIEGLCNKCS